MANLLNVIVTTAVTNAVSPSKQWRRPGLEKPNSVLIQGNLVYGSGGTSINAWVQTSVDGGASWNDVANFSFTTASSRGLFNVSSLTPAIAPIVPTDGTLPANTAKDSIVGDWWRVKYTTVGTYAGNTQLIVDMSGGGGLFT